MDVLNELLQKQKLNYGFMIIDSLWQFGTITLHELMTNEIRNRIPITKSKKISFPSNQIKY